MKGTVLDWELVWSDGHEATWRSPNNAKYLYMRRGRRRVHLFIGPDDADATHMRKMRSRRQAERAAKQWAEQQLLCPTEYLALLAANGWL